MKYTTLGRTGVTVSRLCLGCMSYGTPAWRPWVLDESAAQPFFRRALEAGINFFDTADMYSLGVSEEVTGRALREFGRLDEIVIATKVYFPMSSGPNMGGLSRKHVVQALRGEPEAPRRRDDRPLPDPPLRPVVPLDETLAALDLLVQQGKVRYIGASSGPAWRFAKALSLSDAQRLGAFRVHAEPLQPPLPRGGARDASAVRGGGHRGHSVVAARARPPGGHAQERRRHRRDAARRLRRLRAEPLRPSVRRRRHRGGEEVAAARGVEPAAVALAWLLSRPP